MPKRIYVGNLPVKTEEGDIAKACGRFGAVEDVKVQRGKGVAAARVTMSSDVEADTAASALNGYTLAGNVLVAGTDKSILVNHEEETWML